MHHLRTYLFPALLFGFAVTGWPHLPAQGQVPQLNANDISFLFPLPKQASDLSGLISLDEKLVGDAEIWPLPAFQQVLAAAPTVQVPGQSTRITFFPGEDIEKLSSWRIAGIRVDPSAPGCDASLISKFGSTPQIRLVVQPVFARDSQFRVHDIAAHLAFDLTEAPGRPDKAAFLAAVKDLVALKKELASVGIITDEQLGVHPGFAKPEAGLTGKLRQFLNRHLKPQNLNNIAFMGVRRPEPWIFFIMRKSPSGFEITTLRNSGNASAEMLLGTSVFPAPSTSTFGPTLGFSTSPLLRGAVLEADVSPDSVPIVQRPAKFKEVPDMIANPRISTVLNTNCVSCHTESSLRATRAIAVGGEPLAFKGPGSKPEALPLDTWNVRNFGWGVGRKGKMATATTRTANEAAESADFINKEYLGPASGDPGSAPSANPAAQGSAVAKPVSNGLTLIVTAKSPEDFAKLKGKVIALQSLPPEKNPIIQALEKLENVHFARFVFLDKSRTLMVITTYDDDFDTYIDLFVDNIGSVFNVILEHVEDAPPLPVEQHRAEFNKFIREHDVPVVGELYSAYPQLRAKDIRELGKKVESQPSMP